ncbi:hypothetical protein X743_13700 [Mesorhizobium sp. LNHC252B00]|nr:hypothetical protein X743_13700 [Mesorhizobium sp. LNHC252B00]
MLWQRLRLLTEINVVCRQHAMIAKKEEQPT